MPENESAVNMVLLVFEILTFSFSYFKVFGAMGSYWVLFYKFSVFNPFYFVCILFDSLESIDFNANIFNQGVAITWT